jgi:hypothetical protein
MCVVESISSQGQSARVHGRVINIPVSHSGVALSNVSPESAYPEGFRGFTPCLQKNCDSTRIYATTVSFHILSKSLFIIFSFKSA